MAQQELHLAVLQALTAKLGGPTNGSHQWIHNESLEQLNARQRQIDAVRLWVNTLTDKEVREEYLGWLDFWQHGLSAAYQELKTHTIRDNHAKWKRDLDERYDAVAKFKKENDVPTPP